ncbi:A/G-specific adenine glycosylase [Anaeromyxobacter oryzisoli]|uniref:A/G-specific adenine glycosylase n=1 Tax=Anaeromyxobacter oryzisoli TaxID=2925408 RepID=UPI001F566793|nr:A/G-specific adenine glycosylase [Anaeromyxobacter sp. SG63]
MPALPPARRAALRRRLLAWYDAGHRDLPWRVPQRGADPYRVWLAEVMLQQTQVQAVIPYYERFLRRYPTLGALAAAREEDVLALWAGLGYYARGRNLLAAARAAQARHGGLPASLDALRALPGFGPYTAGAVASIAFGIAAPVVDGNVARVLARLFLVEGEPAAGTVRSRLWALAGELVDPARPGDLNQALMELGATVCVKPAPRCGRCPVAARCAARAAGRERAIPPARGRPARRPLELACALVERAGAVLVVPRPAAGLFGGLLGPPSVELAGEDDPATALARTAREAHGLALAVGEEVARVERTLTHRALTLRGYRCTLRAGPPAAARWVARGEEGVALPTAFSALLATLFSTSRRVRCKNPHSRPGRLADKLARQRSSLTRGSSSV